MGVAREALGAGVGGLGPPRIGAPVQRTPAAAPPPEPARRSASRLALAAGALLVAAAIGVGGALLLDGGDGDVAAAEEVPLPPVPDGAQALGGDLAIPDEALDCRGKAPRRPTRRRARSSRAISRTATLLVPADGLIIGWAVRGASGDSRLM